MSGSLEKFHRVRRIGLARLIGAAVLGLALGFGAAPATAQQQPTVQQPTSQQPTAAPPTAPTNPVVPEAPTGPAAPAALPPAGGFGGAAPLMDYKQEMRRFVESIAEYARRQRSDFIVIVRDGLQLVGKSGSGLDQTVIDPARTYMQAIDGIFVDGVLYGAPKIGDATTKARRARIDPLITMAKNHGLRVLAMDYARKPAVIDKDYRDLAAKGYVPFVASRRGPQITSLPAFPHRPFNENARNVLSLNDVRNFVYIGQSAPFGRQDEFALKMEGTNYDAVIVDVLHGRQPLSRQAIETLKYKKLGSKRLVLARMNVGTAASYRYYWKGDWQEGSPAFIDAPVPGNPDSHFVKYWMPQWQQIISGNTQSYIYGLVRQGFDGVIIEGMDAVTYFDAGLQAVQSQMLK